MRVRLVEDPLEWEALVGTLPGGCILQSYEWGEFKAVFGWRPVRVIVEDGARAVAGAQMLLRSSPLGTVAYIPRGPLVDFARREEADLLMKALHEQARGVGTFFLKMEPALPSSNALAAELVARGFRPGAAVQPRSTIIVDLADETEAMACRLSRRTRYNIRLAERRGLRCERGGEANLDEFYRLLVETARRGRFALHPPAYYRDVWRRFAPRGMAHLMLVRYGDEALAAAMFFTLSGHAYQLYSGSSSSQRRLKPNDLLEWQALLYARELGCCTYDLWGIPDKVGQQLERGEGPPAIPGSAGPLVRGTMGGVYLFKRGFGGAVVRTVGAYDYAYSATRYWLWERALPAARRVLALAGNRAPG